MSNFRSTLMQVLEAVSQVRVALPQLVLYHDSILIRGAGWAWHTQEGRGDLVPGNSQYALSSNHALLGLHRVCWTHYTALLAVSCGV
jgi:hypothetical protein